MTRREFLKSTVVGAAALAAAPIAVAAAGKKKATSETLVATLFKSLSEEQRQKIVFPFEHPLRSKVDNNWHITKTTIAQLLNRDQQAMVRDIFNGLHMQSGFLIRSSMMPVDREILAMFRWRFSASRALASSSL